MGLPVSLLAYQAQERDEDHSRETVSSVATGGGRKHEHHGKQAAGR